MTQFCICVSAAQVASLLQRNAAASLPTLERGQAIRGHYRAGGDELVIHARPCLVLLHLCVKALPHVPHLRILGALHLG
jgi:hypothetical protein